MNLCENHKKERDKKEEYRTCDLCQNEAITDAVIFIVSLMILIGLGAGTLFHWW